MPDRSLPAITLWQPWASLIAIGAKPYEFRGWAAPRAYQHQRVAIHAGVRPVRHNEIIQLVWALRYRGGGETALIADKALPLLEHLLLAPKDVPLGAVVCTAILGEPVRGVALARALLGGDAPINDSDRWEHSNWGWPLTDIRPLEPPEPARGAQGWWRWRMRDG